MNMYKTCPSPTIYHICFQLPLCYITYFVCFILTMDCDTAAASLKKLLVAHDHAGIQLSALGKFCFISIIYYVFHPISYTSISCTPILSTVEIIYNI